MPKIKMIRKRNGDVVDFSTEKISVAITKAFIAIRGDADEALVERIIAAVVDNLERKFDADTPPAVEDVQNFVELELMREGFFDVAKGYIIYRYERTKDRQQKQEERSQEVREKLSQNALMIVKRDGKQEKFSIKQLKKSLSHFIKGYEKEVDADLIIAHCEPNLYDGITTAEISKALILAARAFTERDPAYSRVAARLQFDIVYKEVVGRERFKYDQFEAQYRQAFVEKIHEGVQIGKYDRQLLKFDLEKLSQVLQPERDELFHYLGAQTLADRYFVRNHETHKLIETPQAFWMRVAMGLAIEEEQGEEWAQKFYDTISSLRFVPSTPTLFHAGTAKPQLSSCYLTTIDDDLDHIFKCFGDNAQMSKWSGGVANDWSSLRGTGAYIRKTGVESQGVIPFLKIANDTTVAINRSGKRRGATCAYLETWHYDIEDFIELRKNTGDERRRTHDMNTANWIPDLFMKRVRDDKEWTLFSPDETPDLHHIYGSNFEKRYEYYERLAQQGKMKLHKTIRAKDLWKKMLTMLFETGHPWITFKDPCNVRSPQDHVGVVHSSNLCTEITLNTSADETAVCNLGSVNLARHITDGQLDAQMIEATVKTAMRMLDNVIDINFYPTKEGENSNLKHRPVGLGMMGFQDALYQQNMRFDSNEAEQFADTSMELISYHAILASAGLAAERGTYRSYRGSKWDRGILPMDTLDLLATERGEDIPVSRRSTLDWEVVRRAVAEHGMRNSNCMAIAPTATISNIAGVFPSIEPAYKNIYVKSNMSGEFVVINTYLVDDLKKLNLWNQEMLEQIKAAEGSVMDIDYVPQEIKEKYKETFDIEPEWFIRLAAVRGKWIDQSQSLNLFIKGTSGKIISDAYMLAYKLGLKTTYYLRSLAASSVEASTLDLSKQKSRSTVKQGEAETLTPEPKSATVSPVPEAVPQPQPVMATAAAGAGATGATISLCKLDDPSCESCQ